MREMEDRIVQETREMMIFPLGAKVHRTGQEDSRAQTGESNQMDRQLIASPILIQ